jgi:hypothetical protein
MHLKYSALFQHLHFTQILHIPSKSLNSARHTVVVSLQYGETIQCLLTVVTQKQSNIFIKHYTDGQRTKIITEANLITSIRTPFVFAVDAGTPAEKYGCLHDKHRCSTPGRESSHQAVLCGRRPHFLNYVHASKLKQ